MEETQDSPRNGTPEPVLMAREALAALRTEDAELAARVAKILPGYAVRLAQRGDDISVDILLDAARAGVAALKNIFSTAAAPLSFLERYEKIIAPAPWVETAPLDPLELAAQEGDQAAIRHILAAEPETNTLVKEAALVAAAKYGHTGCVGILLDHGVKVYARNDDALRAAALNNHLETVRLLLDRGADIHVTSDHALRMAARNGNTEMIEFLLSRGANINADANGVLGLALDANQVGAVKLLLSHGAHIDHNHLEIALGRKQRAIAALLIDHCTDTDLQAPQILRAAAANGHADILRHLLTADPDRQIDDGLLSKTICNGHAEAARVLMQHGAQADAHCLMSAARNGVNDIIPDLLGQGVDIIADAGFALSDAAEKGHLETVRLLLDLGANLEETNRPALYTAICAGHTEVAALLLDRGADMSRSGPPAVATAIYQGDFEMALFLIARGLDMATQSQMTCWKLERYQEQRAQWLQTVRCPPPKGLEACDPAAFKPELFAELLPVFEKEGYTGVQAYGYAYQTMALFQSSARVLQYLQKWKNPHSGQPLHDIVHAIALPACSLSGIDLAAWGDAVLKHGPKMAKLIKFCEYLPAPVKSSDGKSWSYNETRAVVAQFAYERGSENPALAAFCFEHAVSEAQFDNACQLLFAKRPDKDMPDITIKGENFDMPDAVFRRLADDDFRGLFLGEMTDCCQSLGGVGAACAEHGFASQNGGFYAIETAKGEIVGQTWAWRGQEGELCFDSLETLGQRVSPDQWKKLVDAVAEDLAARRDHNTAALHIGTGGATPSKIRSAFAAQVASPRDYNGYRDSHQQVVAWQQKGRQDSARRP